MIYGDDDVPEGYTRLTHSHTAQERNVYLCTKRAERVSTNPFTEEGQDTLEGEAASSEASEEAAEAASTETPVNPPAKEAQPAPVKPEDSPILDLKLIEGEESDVTTPPGFKRVVNELIPGAAKPTWLFIQTEQTASQLNMKEYKIGNACIPHFIPSTSIYIYIMSRYLVIGYMT